MTNSPSEHETRPIYSQRDLRQGDIVLRKPWERGAFIAGLVGAVVLALVLVLVGIHFGQAYNQQHANGPPARIGMTKS